MNPCLYRASGKYLTEKPENPKDFFFYQEDAVVIRKELEDGKYQIGGPWNSSIMATVHYTELEHPVLSRPIDYFIDNIKSLIETAESIITKSAAIGLFEQALNIVIDNDQANK